MQSGKQQADRSLARRAYLITAGAVLAAYVLRLGLQPVLSGNHGYSLFYPVVLLTAYQFGRGPAIFGAILSAALGHITFVAPQYHSVGAALTPLAVFGITSGVGVFMITGLTGALRSVAADQQRLQQAADRHASLFRDLQARLGHHMSLLVGVLSLQARGEPDPEVLALLKKAGERSQLMAETYREVSGVPASAVDFVEFTRSLSRVLCLESQRPADSVEVIGGPMVLPPDAATSLGVALAECMAWIFLHQPKSEVRIRVSPHGGRVAVLVRNADEDHREPVALAPTAYMFRAMVEQLGAAVSVTAHELDGQGIEISLPEPANVGSPVATLH